jgi:hypothetical protein
VSGSIAVEVRKAFPRDDGSQALGLPRCDLPLGGTKIADSQETDFAVAPTLLGGPFYQLTKAINRGC